MKTYIFVDESGDPGEPFKTDKNNKCILDSKGNKIKTGASDYYIVSALLVDTKQLHKLEHDILETKNKFGYRDEIKSNTIPLNLYKALLGLLGKDCLEPYYRCVDKKQYKGIFTTKDKNCPRYFHNVFDTYITAKVITRCCLDNQLINCEVVIDRADRRSKISPYNFDDFNNYLRSKVNTTNKKKINHITHADSEYVPLLQYADLISGAIKDSFTRKNPDLKKIISKNLIQVM
jgi:hypothetical protein